MNRTCVIAGIFLLITALPVRGQYTISRVTPSEAPSTVAVDTVKPTSVSNNYYSRAYEEAERKRIKRERNAIEFTTTTQLSQTQFVNWAPGGDNTFAGRATLYFRHQHKREAFTLDYKIEARYGVSVIDKDVFKNEDEFKLGFLMTWKMHRNWSYAASTNLRSQFSEGFKSRTEHVKVSDFMAPGYYDIAAGFNFKSDKSPFNITISPVAGNVIFVLSEELSNKGTAGVEAGKKTKGQLGPSLRVDFDKTFAKKIFRYRWSLYSFTNIKTTPIMRWENTFTIQATKFLSTTLYWLMYYDRAAVTPEPYKMQYNYSIGVGLAYTFKNK